MLWLYRKVIFGELTKDDLKGMLDLDRREVAIFAPLVAVVFWMGIYPESFLDVMRVSVDNVIRQHQAALAAANALAALAQ
jgi:NADH-quinone oxidoreductase subunit M